MKGSQIGSLCAESVALLVITNNQLPRLLSETCKNLTVIFFPSTHNQLSKY